MDSVQRMSRKRSIRSSLNDLRQKAEVKDPILALAMMSLKLKVVCNLPRSGQKKWLLNWRKMSKINKAREVTS